MTEYRFKPIGKVCAGTGQPLAPGAVCHSIVVERNGELQRLDFSAAVWQGPPADAVGYWQCVVPSPVNRQAATMDPETLLKFFDQLLDDPNRQEEKLAYVLALYLLQKRRLRLDGSRVEDDIERLQLSGSRGEGPYEVRNLQLSEDEMAELRAALDSRLMLEWSAA